jgi:excisionase family DNA binding protein
MLENDPEIMTTEQVAKFLQFTVEDLEELLSSGEIPAKKIGKHWRIRKAALITFLGAESQPQPTPKPAVELTGPSVNEPPLPPQPVATPTQPQPSPQLLETLIKITATFDAQVQTAKIEIKAPDFVCPQNLDSNSQSIWNAAKNGYEYAKKEKDLGSQSDRTQKIFLKFNQLHDLNPLNPQIKRHLAYFNYLKNNEKAALQLCKEAAWLSKQAEDWLSVAALAVKEQRELACYSLEQAFLLVSPTQNTTAWYLYVRLVHEFQNYRAIIKMLETPNKGSTQDELKLILETGIYLLKKVGEETLATTFAQKLLEGGLVRGTVMKVFKNLPSKPAESLTSVASQLDLELGRLGKKSVALSNSESVESQQRGEIYNYDLERGYGFLRDQNDRNLFFHQSAVKDEDLRGILLNYFSMKGKPILVTFEKAIPGPKGPIAVGIVAVRSTDELFKSAQKSAEEGKYAPAIILMKKVLAIDASYPSAQDYCDKWRKASQVAVLPTGANPYARAKRAELAEEDLEEAVTLYKNAIDSGDHVESAVKDLAMILDRLQRTEEAIAILKQYRNKLNDQQKIDNVLILMYQKTRQHVAAIELLNKKLRLAKTDLEKSKLLAQMANNELKSENYEPAAKHFQEALKIQRGNTAIERNLALCFSKLTRFEEAEKILNRLVSDDPLDGKTVQLLEAIKEVKSTGKSRQIDEIILETTLTTDSLSSEISRFAQFFLERCTFTNIPQTRIVEEEGKKRYKGSEKDIKYDLEKLEGFAKVAGTTRSPERAENYLTAARIIEDGENTDKFLRYLCRSFTSKGDLVIRQHLDVACDLYCEALALDKGVDEGKGKEQDVANAIVRLLFSTLGQSSVPLDPNKMPSIEEAIETVFQKHPQSNKVFDMIGYAIVNSHYMAKRVLRCLFQKSTLQATALEYLKDRGVSVALKPSLEKFVSFWWKDLRSQKLKELENIKSEFRFLQTIQLTQTSVEDGIKRIKTFINLPFLKLDQERLNSLQQRVFDTALELCKQDTFEEQERLCIQLDGYCQQLLKEMVESPTRLSIEEIYPLVENFRDAEKTRLEKLYQTSTPQLEIRLAEEMGSYTPHDHQIEVQIVISNRNGCSPAESLEVIIVQEDKDSFTLATTTEIRLESSLRGGDRRPIIIPLKVSKTAIETQTFSLPLYIRYSTRSGETTQTEVENLSIRLYSADEFEEINNPYGNLQEVQDPNMFYGRDELIENIAKALQKPKEQSKSVMLFGQKRAGKSSIRYHLKRKLQTQPENLVIDIGNIGDDMGGQSKTPFVHRILWKILSNLAKAIADKEVKSQFSVIEGLSFPKSVEFYQHPDPACYFNELFDNCQQAFQKRDDWCKVRLILLIDEFSYIYDQIIKGNIPDDFMKKWKALLQANYFHAVLVGQDVMTKFKLRFSNEFGTTQDERVSYLREEDAKRLIDEPIKIGGRQGQSRYVERAIDRIVELTAGNPFYIQMFCHRLVEYMNGKWAKFVSDADVERVKNNLIRGVNALEPNKFENLVNSGDTSAEAMKDADILKVLTEVAKNSSPKSFCNRTNINVDMAVPVDDILDDLVKRDVLERRNDTYRIRVDLFREWLVAHQ